MEEIEHWIHNCSEDAENGECDGGYWEPSYGPWTGDRLPALDIANAVWSHTRGWKAGDFELYGQTIQQRSEYLEVMARWQQNLNSHSVSPI